MIYQANDGQWISFVPATGERTFFASEADADQYERQQLMSTIETIPQEWERRTRAVIASARVLIAEARDLGALASDGNLSAVIAATPDGQLLPGTTISKELAAQYAGLLQDLEDFIVSQALNSPDGVTRRMVVNQR